MVSPAKTVQEAITMVNSYEGSAEDFELLIADCLLDPTGVNMAIIGSSLLAKRFLPDGFEQKDGYRIYRYKGID
jgi:hypothetical protein